MQDLLRDQGFHSQGQNVLATMEAGVPSKCAGGYTLSTEADLDTEANEHFWWVGWRLREPITWERKSRCREVTELCFKLETELLARAAGRDVKECST